ncbi:16972_t:CDS:2 [Cetraspora pellucida]|uniref:16972_t:CDS:1 n=1 Tax=Cetraspora pellucida TaxID=1433469 RepID=A0ACA9K1K7_9GLOM|nr:16972_t:CDS:2 [Cetraspora pellucida]
MSLQNISDEDVYLDESYLQPDEETDLISDNKLLLYSDKQKSLNEDSYLSLDNDLYLNNESSLKNENSLNNISFLNEESPNVFAQNAKRKISNSQNFKTKKRPKPGKSWQQCPSVFELKTSTTNLAAHLQTEHRLDKNRPLLSLSGVQETIQPQPIQSDLLQYTLPELFTIKKLQKDLAKNNERSIRNNAKTLKNLLLNEEELLGIQELVELLNPFAHVTTIIGRDHYLTFSIMLSLIKRLQEHLFQKEATLKHSIVRDVHNEIELSFGNHWDEPEVDGYIAAILDLRFKNLSFESEKLKIIKDELKCRIEDAKYIYSTTPSIKNNTSFSLLNSFFEETFQPVCLIEAKLKIYFDMPLMIKYNLSDPLYKKHNPLVFW